MRRDYDRRDDRGRYDRRDDRGRYDRRDEMRGRDGERRPMGNKDCYQCGEAGHIAK